MSRAAIVSTAAFALALSTLQLIAGAAQAQSPVERGRYLVNTILTCGNCHTPRGPGGAFDMTRQLSGGPQVFDEPAFTVSGANITPDRETGIGSWSEADIKRTLRTGVRPNGVPLAPIMPYGFYKIMTEADLDAVVAYLKSVPAVKHEVVRPVYKQAFEAVTPPGAERPLTAEEMRDPVKRGFYLATIGHCMECHTPLVNGRQDMAHSLGRGGQEFKGPWGVSVSRNITSNREKGIGAWTDAEIKTAITQGRSRDGSPLKPPMGFPLYAGMTADDLDAVVAWLRTLPPMD